MEGTKNPDPEPSEDDRRLLLEIDGVQTGPITVREVEEQVAKGLIDPYTAKVWYEGMEDWSPLSSLVRIELASPSDSIVSPVLDASPSTKSISNYVPATDFEASIIHVCDSAVDQEALAGLLQKEVEKNGPKWPAELSGARLVSLAKLIHLPLWSARGEARSKWVAQVGTLREVPSQCSWCFGRGRLFSGSKDECTYCGGRGQVFKHQMFFETHNGVASVGGDFFVLNWDATAWPLKCGMSDEAKPRLVDREVAHGIEVLKPLATTTEDALEAVNSHLRRKLKENAREQAEALGDEVRDVGHSETAAKAESAEPLLYPIWAGSYSFKEKSYAFQVDGISGKLWFEHPGIFVLRQRLPVITICVMAFIAAAVWIYTRWFI